MKNIKNIENIKNGKYENHQKIRNRQKLTEIIKHVEKDQKYRKMEHIFKH